MASRCAAGCKADPRTALIHVILVTAHRATSGLKARGLEAGADDFIAKPIDNVELAAKLRVMLRLRSAEQALRRERDHLEEKVRERTQALQDAEYRYRTLFQSAADPIFISDLEGSLLEVNDEACRLLGYTRGELLHLSVSDLITPEYAPVGRSSWNNSRPRITCCLRRNSSPGMGGLFPPRPAAA